MNGKQLKQLASIANIAKLDMSPGSMVVTSQPTGVLAWYYGIYFAGGILVNTPMQLPTMSLAPEQFQAIAALFDDVAEVQFNPGASGLILQSGKRKLDIRYGPAPVSPLTETYHPITGVTPVVRVKTSDLVAELTLIKGVAAKNATMPILGGTRVLAAGSNVGFLSANGASMVYQSAISGTATERFDIVPPVEEFLTALSIFADEEYVGLALMNRALIIRGENAVAKINTMAGEFPDLMAQLKKIDFTEKVSLPAYAIKSLVTAARAFKAPNLATIRPAVTGEGIVMQTEATEIGQFEEVVDGSLTRMYAVSVDDLDMASRLSGDVIELSLSAERSMSLLQIGNRRLYINCRAV